MPSQQEVRWSQLKIGIIVLISSIILVTLLFLMTSASGLGILSKKITVFTYFENAAGVKEGSAVNVQGVTVGSVKSVTIDPSHKLTPVKVVMKINGKYQADLHTDSKAALTTVGVLGDTVVDINSQVAVGPPLQDGDELKTLETPSIQDVVKASQGTIEQVNVILAKMNTIVDGLSKGNGSAGMFLTDKELYNKAVVTIDGLSTLERNLNAGHGSVGKLLTDDALYNRLNDTSLKLDQVIAQVQSGKGTAGKLLYDDSLYNNLNTTLTKTNAMLDQVQNGKGAAGMLINDPAFAQSLRDTIGQTNALVAGVNAGKGTLGKLTTDDQAYTNLNKLLTESTTLVTTIRQDPKKYLTIHLKIF